MIRCLPPPVNLWLEIARRFRKSKVFGQRFITRGLPEHFDHVVQQNQTDLTFNRGF